jgi:hypothetical protein
MKEIELIFEIRYILTVFHLKSILSDSLMYLQVWVPIFPQVHNFKKVSYDAEVKDI